MADGTLKVGTITTSSGSGNIAIGSGVTLLSNTPAFEATMSADQGITSGATTKIEFDTQVFDTDNMYDHSTNYRFTPTVTGKYLFFSCICFDGQSASNLSLHQIFLYKNGSTLHRVRTNPATNYFQQGNLTLNYIDTANGSSDYYEIYVYAIDTSGNPQILGTTSSVFGAYRIGA
jgi:hypothetical protein